ncbi:MAG: 23S rRNA (pseudouridine(1915)-N(3))-methyltransferase RlmH [Oscillospiraceae bacterium]|nr:23S rRNA (pseudouridine(1915)-N(3))-methyltransferase RlmH [Oscillospiraceae bacterium]
MLEITIIAVGKMKEKFYIDAASEYLKRLGAYARVAVTELPEARRPDSPSPAETAAAMEREADAIFAAVPKGGALISMCVEGREMTSEEFSRELETLASSGFSKLCFVIGGSDGLSQRVKSASRIRLSMSRMTLPHHLARVMLLEQLYRAMNISSGGKYHK